MVVANGFTITFMCERGSQMDVGTIINENENEMWMLKLDCNRWVASEVTVSLYGSLVELRP